MKLRWFSPILLLLPSPLKGSEPVPPARIATVVIHPGEVTTLHLRPEFDSVIRMPEEITSIVLGSPESFKAEHNEGEPTYVYVKPITKNPAVSNLMIATKSGAHVTLELISEGSATPGTGQAVDFLIEYRDRHCFLLTPAPISFSGEATAHPAKPVVTEPAGLPANTSALDEEYAQQIRINAPAWTHWDGNQIETSIGEVRQWNNQVVVSYSVLNHSDEPVEILPPQIQITGRRLKKKKEGKGITSDQLEIREFRLSKTRLEAGERADGVAVYDRPNFKQSTEKLYLQLAQADQVDRPILVGLPFTPTVATNNR
jgi:hypothetical protein